uniref:C-type lectin n=1 Tax=Penaeus japonicus TaxID=27405 RepID=A0A0A0P6I7_PENJP|nr:C-type lectin [Penaeus japonicus]
MLPYLVSAFALCSFIVGTNGESFWNFANLTSEDPHCPNGYSTVGNQCLMFVTFAEGSHKDAMQVCHAASGELVAISTPTQFVHVVNHIYSQGYTGRHFWLDGSDAQQEGKWVTSSGQAVPRGTPFWAAFQDVQLPNNYNGQEHCLLMDTNLFSYLNDAPCAMKSNFICQYMPQKEEELRDSLPATEAPTTPHSEASRGQCPTFFVEVGGLCMMFVTWAQVTWTEARQTCGDSSDLLAITDAEVLRALYLYLHRENIADHTFWLGGSDSQEEKWIYTTGESVPMGTPFWGLLRHDSFTQEPNGGTSENCLMLQSEGSHYFRDTSCSSRLNPLCVYHG